MLDGWNRYLAALGGLTLVACVALVPSAPALAEPDIEEVQTRVDRLYREAEQASERYNDARLRLSALRKDVRALEAAQARQDARLAVAQGEVRDSVIRQYEGQGISAVSRVVVSEDPEDFLGQLSTMSAYNDLQAEMFARYSTALEALEARHEATEERAADVAATEERLAAEQATIQDRLDEARSLLGRLEAEEREALAREAEEREARERAAVVSRGQVTRTSESPEAPVSAEAPEVTASGNAAAAVAYAMAQVGDAYVYGASGPDAFDCSGLTSMAWAQAGVALPHSSTAQYASGAQVSESALQPGDLVFYYSPISHVGMYIGNGMIVHAANPSTGVNLAPLHSMPYVGAVRPG